MDKLPLPMLTYAKRIAEIPALIKVYDLQIFPVRVDGWSIFIDV